MASVFQTSNSLSAVVALLVSRCSVPEGFECIESESRGTTISPSTSISERPRLEALPRRRLQARTPCATASPAAAKPMTQASVACNISSPEMAGSPEMAAATPRNMACDMVSDERMRGVLALKPRAADR